ncbi:hypothetical protein [Chryseobacterium sp.]|uniref:hypothetical protein n=1 Tax=Chryseobacterium sp. TaxID=1871047 RepID=UPI0025BDAE63|nr:hypothetical protein [Chryseobacterium sp.]MBV8327457.1 hypothetical protein [Chryseobacterium sp.]
MQKNISSIINDDLFTKIYNREFINKRSLDDSILYNHLENTFLEAFDLIKENKLEESKTLFNNGEKLFPKKDNEDVFGLILNDTLYPKKAYLYYREGKIRLAGYLTLRSIITNQKIKEKSGVDLPVFVQIQQYQNISVICFKTKYFSEGIILNCRLLLFLFTKKDVGVKYLSHFAFTDKTEESGLKCSMAYQIVFATIQNLYRIKNKRYLYSFIEFVSNILSEFAPEFENEMVLKEFLETISQYDSEKYSENAADFIEKNKDVLFPGTTSILTVINKIYENEKVI